MFFGISFTELYAKAFNLLLFIPLISSFRVISGLFNAPLLYSYLNGDSEACIQGRYGCMFSNISLFSLSILIGEVQNHRHISYTMKTVGRLSEAWCTSCNLSELTTILEI